METKGNNNLSKAGSQYGVFSSLFFISGVSVTVARLSFQIGGGGQHLSPLFVVVKTRYLDVPSKDCKIYFKKIDKLYDGMVFSRGFSPK